MNTIYNVLIEDPKTKESHKFSYNKATGGQARLAKSIIKGFEQQGWTTTVLPASLKKYPPLAVWSATRAQTAASKFAMSGSSLGAILKEAGIR